MSLELRRVVGSVRRQVGGRLFMLRVFALLVVMRGVIKVFALRTISARLGTPMQETPHEGLAEEDLRYAHRVAQTIDRVAPLTPTTSNCYPQGLTAWWLLRRRRMPTTFYYGAAFDESGTALEAHVWVRCGPLIVTGGGPHRRYAPMTWYASVHECPPITDTEGQP